MHAKLSQSRAWEHSFQMSKITEQTPKRDLPCKAKINTITLINRRTHIQEILQVKCENVCMQGHVYVCVCVYRLVYRGGLDNVCILRHKRPADCLQIE